MLKGVSHVHTTYSFDGKLTPEELQAFFAARGIQFVLLSEHIESLDAASINSLIAECSRVSNNECVLVPGIEVDEMNLLIFGIREVRPYDSIDDLIQICRGQGALLGYAHPVKKHAVPPAVMEMIEGFEVWNTRYDGKLMPRQSNVVLFQSLLRQNQNLRPLVGLDFHKPSDYALVFMKVDCGLPSDVLSTIRAGRYSLHESSKAIQVYPGRRSFGAWAATAKGTMYTHVYDLAVSWHRWLSRCGIPVPRMVKMALKKIF